MKNKWNASKNLVISKKPNVFLNKQILKKMNNRQNWIEHKKYKQINKLKINLKKFYLLMKKSKFRLISLKDHKMRIRLIQKNKFKLHKT